MTATPAPGDLSARLLAAAESYDERGVNVGELLREAIAALSALPAGGGVDDDRTERLAAPAAGKGVDGLAEAVRGLRFDVYELTTPELRAAFDGKKTIAVVDPGTVSALKAALTRQPVAGGGKVLVPKIPTPKMDAAGKQALTDNGVDSVNDSDALLCWNAMLAAAAPAATPTDGGEG